MRHLLVGTGIASALFGAPVYAQTVAADATAPPVMQEIVVTAQKRTENLQDVPVSVTALSAETLQDRHVTDILDLTNLAPGLQVKTGDNAANPRIFIRGVGLNDFNPATASPIGIYVDGVYVASPLAQFASLYDLARVEVLRGPQGTLYGRNTTGGAINIISRQPSQSYEADASVEYGRFNWVDARFGVGGPIVADKLMFRVAGVYQRDDGYTLNRLTDQTGNNTDRYDLRATLLWKPVSGFDADLSVHLGQSRGGSILAYDRTLSPKTAAATGPDGLCAPSFYTSGQCTNILGYANTSGNLYQGDYRFMGRDQVKLFGSNLTINKDVDGLDLVSVTAYQRADRNDQEDSDADPLPVLTGSYVAREETFSQELRLQSSSKQRLRYVLGLYYAYDYLTDNSEYFVLPGLVNVFGPATDITLGIGNYAWPLHQETDSYAAFSQVDYDLTSRLTVTGGVRYSAEHKGFNYTSVAPNFDYTFFHFNDNKTFDSVSGKFSLQYRLTNSANIYASYNRGFKSGGFFSGQTTVEADVGPYKNEDVNAYEVGAKTELFGRMLRADVSGFYYDYTNLQVYTIVQRGLITEQLFTNASAARIYGGEIELSSSPLRGLDLSTGLSLLNAEYVDFTSVTGNYSGNQLPSAPHESLNASAHYVHPLPVGDLVSQVDLDYRSKIFFETSNTPRLSDPDRTFVDAELGWRAPNGRYELGLYGRNLFNETNISNISPIPALGFDFVSVGKPRTYGMYLRAKY